VKIKPKKWRISNKGAGVFTFLREILKHAFTFRREYGALRGVGAPRCESLHLEKARTRLGLRVDDIAEQSKNPYFTEQTPEIEELGEAGYLHRVRTDFLKRNKSDNRV